MAKRFKRDFSVRMLSAAEKVRRPPQQYDTPACCDRAGIEIMWHEKGDEIHGPPQDGWAVYIEGGGPGPECSSHWLPAKACPFCGTPLSTQEVRAR